MIIILLFAFWCLFCVGAVAVFYGYSVIPETTDSETTVINEAQGDESLLWFGIGFLFLILSAIALAVAFICKLLA